MTAFLFSESAKGYRRYFKQIWFWGVLTALVVIHLVTFVIVLLRTAHWQVIWFLFLFPPETIVINHVIAYVGRHMASRPTRKRE